MAPAGCTKTALEGPMENIPATASPAPGAYFARGREWVHKPARQKPPRSFPLQSRLLLFRPGETPLEVPTPFQGRPRFERL